MIQIAGLNKNQSDRLCAACDHTISLSPGLFLGRTALDAVAMIARRLRTMGSSLRDKFLCEIGDDVRRWLVTTADTASLESGDMRAMGCHRCLLCSSWHHALEMGDDGKFCRRCGHDLVYLGHRLDHVARLLKAGKPIGEPCAPRRQG